MYKLSKYLVNQEIYDSKDKTDKIILFSTRSSVVKVLDKKTFTYLVEKNFSNLENDVFNIMKRDKIIVDENENELNIILEENKSFIKNSKELYLVIQPTAFCPLGCHYCGQLHSPKGMTDETQKQITERVIKKLSEKKYNSLRICWFGAEPLSGLNVLKKLSYGLQSIAKNFNINYSAKIVTNGWRLSLPIAQDLVTNHKINHIEITLDGIAEFHDARRHTKTGKETFHVIYDNLFKICTEDNLNIKISVRCNIDERNKEGISPLIKKISQDNFQKKISIYFAQIHSWGNDAHKLAADKKNFSAWEIEWFLEMESHGFKVNYLHPRKKQVCMAMNPMSELIDPNGGIFGCTEVSLVPSYENNGINLHQLGSVSTVTLDLKQNNFSNFYEENEIKNFSCSKCEILPICGGACPKEWKEGRIPCPPIKFNIKDRMLLYYIKAQSEKEYLNFLHGVSSHK